MAALLHGPSSSSKGGIKMPKSITLRGKNKYQLMVSVGYDMSGKQKMAIKTIRAKNYREAQHELVLFKANVQKHRSTYMESQTIAQFAAYWQEHYCAKELAPKTQQSYKNQLNRRILPVLGNIPLGRLKPIDIIKFVNSLQESAIRYDGKECPVSGQTIRYCIRTLSSMLQTAVRWGLIDTNPSQNVTRIKIKPKRMQLPDEQGVAKMLEALQDEPLKYRTIVMLALDSGLRRGEIMALEWPAVNLKNNSILVKQSNLALPGKGIITKLPKTESSIRTVNISSGTAALLQQYKDWQDRQKEQLENQWLKEEKPWVFTQWNGKAMFPETPSHWFRQFLKRHGLPPMPFHGLRHLTATILIAQNTPLKNVSSRLGHSDIRTTANIYSEALQSVDRVAADNMGAFLEKMKTKE